MAKNEKTSPDIASLAAKALRKPGSLTKKQIKSLAGAALTQAADKLKALVTPAPATAPKPKAAAKPKPAAKAKPKTAATPKPKATAKPKAAAKPKTAAKRKPAGPAA